MAAVLTAIAGLPRRRREALVLRHWLGLSHQEIATSIRLTRADGTITTLAAPELTPTPNGFLAAVIYTPGPDPVITQATAIDSDGRDLNTLHLP